MFFSKLIKENQEPETGIKLTLSEYHSKEAVTNQNTTPSPPIPDSLTFNCQFSILNFQLYVVSSLTMLINIQTLLLNAGSYTDTVNLLEDYECEQTKSE